MRLPPLLVGAALILTACGGSAAPAAEVGPDTTTEAAAANGSNLIVAGDPRNTEVLVVADGSITTLADEITGDRPLLLWFWAPH